MWQEHRSFRWGYYFTYSGEKFTNKNELQRILSAKIFDPLTIHP